MTLESVAAYEAAEPAAFEREVVLVGMPVPVGEMVSGKVRGRVEKHCNLQWMGMVRVRREFCGVVSGGLCWIDWGGCSHGPGGLVAWGLFP
jgi:hypothetical protein